MPLRASAPATEERSPRRSGAATMTCGGWRSTEGSAVWRTSSISVRCVAGMASGAAGALIAALEELVRPLHQVGNQTRLPRTPRTRAGGPAVGLGERGEEVKGEAVAAGAGNVGDGGGVVEVATGRRIGQQEVVTDQVDQDVDIGGRKSHPCGHGSDHLDADGGVVAREPLADVVQQGADEEKVGTLDVPGESGGECGRLEQVPVDGEAVIRVALRLVAHGGPFGQQAHEQAVLVERLDLVDSGRALGQEVDESLARLVGPGVSWCGHAVGQAVERALGDGPVEPGGGGGQAQWE